MAQMAATQQSSERKHRLEAAVEELFSPSTAVGTEVAREYLKQLTSNLVDTESALGKSYAQIVGLTLVFLLFDSGVAKSVSIQGVSIERAGRFLILFPILISFVNYLCFCRIIFTSELRLAIALLYKKLHEAIYFNYLDLLVQSPSFRNTEKYESVRLRGEHRRLTETTTTLVTLGLVFGPIIAATYFLYRTWHYSDLPKTIWFVAFAICVGLTVRVALFFSPRSEADPYSVRRKQPPAEV